MRLAEIGMILGQISATATELQMSRYVPTPPSKRPNAEIGGYKRRLSRSAIRMGGGHNRHNQQSKMILAMIGASIGRCSS